MPGTGEAEAQPLKRTFPFCSMLVVRQETQGLVYAQQPGPAPFPLPVALPELCGLLCIILYSGSQSHIGVCWGEDAGQVARLLL